MTAQISDQFIHDGKKFDTAGISDGKNLFKPSGLGLAPIGRSTGCRRGYQAVFSISNSQLILDSLHINLFKGWIKSQRLEGPPINSITPLPPNEDAKIDWFNNHYLNLNHRLDYTGGLLIAREFINELYVHIGFHPAWKHRVVFELLFENGLLLSEIDRSSEMAEYRNRIKALESSTKTKWNYKDFLNWIEKSFGRKYVTL